MIEMKLNRLLLTLVIKKFISNDDQLIAKLLKTENIAVKQVVFFKLDFFN